MAELIGYESVLPPLSYWMNMKNGRGSYRLFPRDNRFSSTPMRKSCAVPIFSRVFTRDSGYHRPDTNAANETRQPLRKHMKISGDAVREA